MATVAELVLFGVVLVVQTLLAAVSTRFFRIRMKTRWGWVIYTAMLTPLLLFVVTLITTGVLGIGPDLGSPGLAIAVTIGVPLALGFTLDLLYVPPPEEYDLPDTQG
ncbi:hypothetical protein RYH80_00860 [Halobaculum sp. MBLA0147]|uniref:hypothetical protein n=1 Tax=Halobaculum sp. MBLA0147 TaxID=3079934 RepID=UPI0035245AEA